MNKYWTMNISETQTNSAEIFIYGTIGSSWWEESVSASQFAKDLKALGNDIENITVHINSTGGSVYDGLAIRSLLLNHKAYVTAIVEGLAASIASVIITGADEIIVSLGSNIMIHNPLMSAFGEAKDLRDTADFLDKIRDSLVDVYVKKTGLERDELISMLDAETWMSAEEAVEKGFADKVEDSLEVTAKMAGTVAVFNGISMDFSKFTNIPERLLEMPPPSLTNKTVQKTVQQPKNKINSTQEGKPMDLAQLKNEYPDLYNQIVNEGVNQERTRIQTIDNLAVIPGFEEEIKNEILNKAKYETGVTAEQASLEVNQWISNNFEKIVENKAKADFIKNSTLDANPLNNIGGAPAPQNHDNPQEELSKYASGLAGIMNKKRGLVK
ncbi:Clp protease ClpP [Niallia taxi]|uniref:head maturation protease, ClpP-related n=1 Tax=Niallia taxi TaxID=2499688 RepID=UPI0021A2AD99|nr:head maturation protease, ClpP-related [Niallia taxi]MCT2347130.1 Clp protease ClpP [Niallia taxi]